MLTMDELLSEEAMAGGLVDLDGDNLSLLLLTFKIICLNNFTI